MTALSGSSNPVWIRALLAQPWVAPLARLALVSAYLIGGLNKALNFESAIAEQARFGLHPPALWAALAVTVEIVGSLCVVFRRYTWSGAGGLAMLTIVAMLVANDFWNQTGTARFMALNSFFEHLGLIGALVLATMVGDVNRAAGGRRD